MVTLKVDRDSEISRKLRAAGAAGEPLLVDTGDRVYTLRVQTHEQADMPDIWANYDSNRVLKALEDAAGILEGVDVEQLKADLRIQRGQNSRGRPE
ncbi:MAG TPA: hypothetical protein VMM78_08750 [Thermomicrobiales bacterium]|nr:hypothetical protein [Thermomicrobiales bacterium]